MEIIRSILRAFTAKERRTALITLTLFVASGISLVSVGIAAHSTFVPVAGGTYREGVVGQPSIVNPLTSPNPTDQELSGLFFAPLGTFLSNIETNKDATVYTLKLKEDLAWSDGEPLTSDDLLFSVATAQDPAAESAFAASLRGVSTERVSMLQVKLTLPSPSVLFKDLLARLPVVPAHVWSRIPVKNYHLSEYALVPVGNGPYRVKEVSRSKDGFIEEYHLVPNEYYVASAPLIQDFYVEFFGDAASLLDSFRLRKINGFGYVPPMPEAHEVMSGAVVSRIPLPRAYAIFLNDTANDLLDDPYFRTALSYAVNRTHLATDVFQGDAAPYFPGVSAEDAKSAYNPEAAQAALAKAKHDADAKVTFTVPDVPFLVKTAEMALADWRAIGIQNVEIRKVPLARFREDVLVPRAYEMVLAPYSLSHPDDLYPFWHSSARGPSGENYSFYANAKVDAALEKIRVTDDRTDREALVAGVNAALARDLPAVFLVSLPYTYVHADDLEGFPTGPFVTPGDRFLNVASWSIVRARVLE